MTEETIFQEALARSAADRARFLDQACSGQPQLRAAVEALLAAHQKPDNLLDQPPGNLAATMDSQPAEADSAATGEHTPHAFGSQDADEPRTSTTDYCRDGVAGVVIGGRYTLQEKIGEGGMGEVWVAKQTEPVKRKVALKLIKTGMDSWTVLQRFEQERQALALMDHPHIARVLDGGMTPTGQPFFVMELVNGLPLTKFCDELKLTLKQRLELFVPICQAVQHAHQKGIVHRDLKPANILVTMIDGKPVPKVIDFGVAKATSGKLTEETLSTGFGAVVGTLEYMSPEQAGFSGEDIDTRSDIYSLGVILYELLTGLRPIDAKRLKKAALTEMIRIIQEEEPSKPSTRLSTDESLPSLAAVRQIEPRKLTALLRGELDWVVMKCLEKQRDRRYETANALARDVQRYLTDEAVEARPPSAGYRLKKFVKRNKGQVIAAAAVFAALCIGLAGFAWQSKVASDQRDIAIKAQKAEAEQRRAADQARDAETDARRRTERALVESREKTALMTYERAQALCEEEKADLGLLWMARSQEMTPPEAKDLDRAIRTSINLWGQQLNTVRRAWNAEWSNLSAYRDISVSPDGRSILLVNDNGLASLWDKSTGELRFVLSLEADAPAVGTFTQSHGRFSPDGRFVAIGRSDHRFVKVWNATTGQLVGKPLAHEEPVTRVSFQPADGVLVTAAGNKIHFWNVERSAPEEEPLTSEQRNDGVEVSGDGHQLLAWSRRQVVVWDLESRKPRHALQGIDFDVFHAGFSPNGRFVLASGLATLSLGEQPHLAQLWEATTGLPVGMRMQWDDRVTAASQARPCFRPDGRLLVTGGTPLRMWQVPSGKPLGAIVSNWGTEQPVFEPEGKVLVAFAPGNPVPRFFFDVASTLEPVSIVSGLGDEQFSTFGFGPDGRTMIRTSYHREKRQSFCRLYDLASGNSIGESLDEAGARADHADPAQPVYSVDGRSVAIVVGDNACQIFDTETGGARTPRMITTSSNTRIRALAFSPDGQLLASGDLGGVVRLWNTATGQPVGGPIIHQRTVNRICFSPDGQKLLVAGGGTGQFFGEARLWDVATGQPLGPALTLDGGVRDAAFSPDGTTFATGAFKLILWDSATSRKLWEAPSSSLTEQLVFAPDGRKLLARHWEEKAARLYDARTGEPSSPLLRHQAEVISAALSRDGDLVLTSSSDRTVRLWDASLGLRLGPGWTNSNRRPASFSPDGQSVLMIDETNSLVSWPIPPPLEGTPERIRRAVHHDILDFSARELATQPQKRQRPACGLEMLLVEG